MTEATTTTEDMTPMQKAIAGGYEAEAEVSREDRAKNFVASLEHAIKHNAPIALSMIREARDLLGVAEEVVEKVEAQDGQGPADPNLNPSGS